MSECIISRRGSAGVSGTGMLRTEIIASNQNWQVPLASNKNFDIRIFGGGSAGGGSGWMNNAIINNLTTGQIIPITIGAGGDSTNFAGGTTSFGTYLSANGGSGSSGGAGGFRGTGAQFGGGLGCNGGIWGGGGGGWGGNNGSSSGTSMVHNAGSGGTYGGGGGGGASAYGGNGSIGGAGGTYGGGGGGGIGFNVTVYTTNWRINVRRHISGAYGIGGTYAGNGGNGNTAENGTNTMRNTSVPSNLRGYGRTRSYGITPYVLFKTNGTYNNSYNIPLHTGGGGGFGGWGGASGYVAKTVNVNHDMMLGVSGGGGGGYGSNGGNGQRGTWTCGGGGGGYGGHGEDGAKTSAQFGGWKHFAMGGGGGGYFSNGLGGCGGGYYNYCHGGGGGIANNPNYAYLSSFGAGPIGGKPAQPGVVIIQYYTQDLIFIDRT